MNLENISKSQLKELKNELNHIIQESTIINPEKINCGSEGYCFKKENTAIKLFDKASNTNYKKIICKNDLDLDSFLFPEKLLICENKLVGYTTKWISNNLFSFDSYAIPEYPQYIVKQIDKSKLLNAIKVFIEDLKVLSNHNIQTLDVLDNLIFDGEKLYAIDTLGYTYKSKETFEYNIDAFKSAVCETMNFAVFHGYEIIDWDKQINNILENPKIKIKV